MTVNQAIAWAMLADALRCESQLWALGGLKPTDQPTRAGRLSVLAAIGLSACGDGCSCALHTVAMALDHEATKLRQGPWTRDAWARGSATLGALALVAEINRDQPEGAHPR